MYIILIALCLETNGNYCYPIREKPIVYYETKEQCVERMKQIATKELLDHLLQSTTEKGDLVGRCLYFPNKKPGYLEQLGVK